MSTCALIANTYPELAKKVKDTEDALAQAKMLVAKNPNRSLITGSITKEKSYSIGDSTITFYSINDVVRNVKTMQLKVDDEHGTVYLFELIHSDNGDHFKLHVRSDPAENDLNPIDGIVLGADPFWIDDLKIQHKLDYLIHLTQPTQEFSYSSPNMG